MHRKALLVKAVAVVGLLLWLIICSSAGTAQLRYPLPVPDVPGFKTLKCDLHQHTVISDGEVWPTTRVTEAWRDGFDAIAISDHADYNPHKEDMKNDLVRSYELARPLAESLGILLVRGIELAEGDTHCNALFVTDPNALRGLKLIEALQKARAQDAFVFWNHPGWKQTAEWFPLIASAYDQKLIQGMEIVNGDTFYPEAYPWIEEKKLTIMANSDEHVPALPGQAGTLRPVTLVFARTADLDGVREALFQRRTAAWMGGELWGPEEFLKGLYQGAVKVETPELKLRARGTGAALRIRNDSALPFKMRIRQAPQWLRGIEGAAQLRGQRILAVSLSVAKGTPPGSKQVDIELEITNFHIGPGNNLLVHLPLVIHVVE